MNERSQYTDFKNWLSQPEVIEGLGLGSREQRIVKPKDGWGMVKGKMVRIPNPADYYYVNDCIELKAVKRKTRRGLVFKLKDMGKAQHEYVTKHRGVLAIAFIYPGNRQDALICYTAFRYEEVCGFDRVDIDAAIALSPNIKKGTAYKEFYGD